MSRREAQRRFTTEDHKQMSVGVECRTDVEVINETIETMMAAESDLVEIVHTLRQLVSVKG
jgi:tRNA-splicing ligase RtcB (3'-phosphate/5'-hydroxy nucleic acid ligase)